MGKEQKARAEKAEAELARQRPLLDVVHKAHVADLDADRFRYIEQERLSESTISVLLAVSQYRLKRESGAEALAQKAGATSSSEGYPESVRRALSPPGSLSEDERAFTIEEMDDSLWGVGNPTAPMTTKSDRQHG